MDKLIARLNIELFQRRLAEEKDEARRKILLSLLAKEERNSEQSGMRARGSQVRDHE